MGVEVADNLVLRQPTTTMIANCSSLRPALYLSVVSAGCGTRGCNSCRRVQLVASLQVVEALTVVIFSVSDCDAYRSVHC
jgi:hypothetical protein